MSEMWTVCHLVYSLVAGSPTPHFGCLVYYPPTSLVECEDLRVEWITRNWKLLSGMPNDRLWEDWKCYPVKPGDGIPQT